MNLDDEINHESMDSFGLVYLRNISFEMRKYSRTEIFEATMMHKFLSMLEWCCFYYQKQIWPDEYRKEIKSVNKNSNSNNKNKRFRGLKDVSSESQQLIRNSSMRGYLSLDVERLLFGCELCSLCVTRNGSQNVFDFEGMFMFYKRRPSSSSSSSSSKTISVENVNRTNNNNSSSSSNHHHHHEIRGNDFDYEEEDEGEGEEENYSNDDEEEELSDKGLLLEQEEREQAEEEEEQEQEQEQEQVEGFDKYLEMEDPSKSCWNFSDNPLSSQTIRGNTSLTFVNMLSQYYGYNMDLFMDSCRLGLTLKRIKKICNTDKKKTKNDVCHSSTITNTTTTTTID